MGREAVVDVLDGEGDLPLDDDLGIIITI